MGDNKMSRKSHRPFFERLKQLVKDLKHMKHDEIHVISINANFGHYQILIGAECRQGEVLERPIEINGEIHHLFLSEEEIRTQPSRKQLMENLKDTVIMRNLHIHFKDPKGDGRHLQLTGGNGIHPSEYINLAGKRGQRLLNNASSNVRMSLEAYRIIQQDILKSLKKKHKTA